MRAGDPRHPPADPRPCRALRPGRADGVVRGYGPASKACARRHVHRCEGRALVASVAPRRRRIADRRRARGTGSAPGVRGRASRRSRSMRVSAWRERVRASLGRSRFRHRGPAAVRGRGWAAVGRRPGGHRAQQVGARSGKAGAETIAMAMHTAAQHGRASSTRAACRALEPGRPDLERSEDRSPPVRRPAQAGLGRSAAAREGCVGRNRATRRLPRRGVQSPRAQRPMHAPRLHSSFNDSAKTGTACRVASMLGPRGAAVNP